VSGHTFILPPDARESMLDRIRAFALQAYPGKRVKVTVEQYQRRRSDEQNKFLWGYVYPHILASVPDMAGWTADDLHDFFLIEHFGYEVISGFGRQRIKPLRRSSKLTTGEFADYVAHIQQFMAERGVYIEDPNERLAA